MAIKNLALTNSTQALLGPVPADTSYAITVMMICNTATPTPGDEEADNETVYVYAIANGDQTGANATNTIINGINLRAGETFTLDTEKLILEENDTLAIRIGGSGTVSTTVSYVEI